MQMTYFSASNIPLNLVSDAHITGTYKPKQRLKEFYTFFYTCSIGSHFHACSIVSLMWLSPDKEATIMKEIQNFALSQKWTGVYSSTSQFFCFFLKVCSGQERRILLLITELMKSLECFVSRNSCTSRIPCFENFTKIGKFIGNEDPDVHLCCLDFWTTVVPFWRILSCYLQDNTLQTSHLNGHLLLRLTSFSLCKSDIFQCLKYILNFWCSYLGNNMLDMKSSPLFIPIFSHWKLSWYDLWKWLSKFQLAGWKCFLRYCGW